MLAIPKFHFDQSVLFPFEHIIMSIMVVVGLLFLLATAHSLSEVNGGNHHAQYCIKKKVEALLSFKGHVDLGNNATELSEGFGLNHKARCIEKEKEALLSFKRVVDPGNILSSWTNGTNQNCCNWRGVTCDNQTNHVIKLDFSDVYDHDNKTDAHDWPIIGGEIGSSLVELRYLKYLDLSSHGFSRIPKFIGSFKELMYLSLAWNPISGTIPPQLGNLTKLQFLDLASDSDQMIVDNLEWLSRLTSLRTFRLMHTKFTRDGIQSFRLPPFLSTLEVSNCLLPEVDISSLSYMNSSNFLRTLILRNNSIHPTAITWFLNSSTNLVELSLTNNTINGSFPNSFGQKNSLKIVDLSSNEVGNGVLKSLGNLTDLKVLDLSSNNLDGALHDLLEFLDGSTKNSLEILNLYSNQLGGLVLDDEKTFPSLRELILDHNQLEGPFPNRLSRFPNLRILYLDDNQLTGPLPDLSSMASLTSFTARNNKFNSTTIESIGELYYLETLDVSLNSLTGVISEVNLQSSKLKELDFSLNPVALKFDTNWVPSFQLKFINLSYCKLGPQFPSWLQTQSNLHHLDISNAGIAGLVPTWFSNITSKLSCLYMSSNLLNGTLPNFIMKGDFRQVNLSFNQFHGSIPPSLSNSHNLYLSNNKFTDIRSFLCEAKDRSLRILDLYNNQLSGSLPDCWENFQFLFVLNLGNNTLSGEIPSSIGLRYIQTLQLRQNNFSGNLPSSLKNCTELKVLDFGKNSLKGTIPSWIGERLTSLVFLSLKSNKFYGSIPLSLCHLTEIQILDLSSNDLSGPIPRCIKNFTSMVQKDYGTASTISVVLYPYHYFGICYVDKYRNIASIMWKGVEYEYNKILGLLRIIDLSSNKLTGEIPVEVTHLVQLVQLNLSSNGLSGAIPKNIGNLSKIEALDLSYNDLLGEIPVSLAQVSSLNYLDLSNNRLSGRIPASTQLQSFNASTYTENLGLCGPPLTGSCPGDEALLDRSDETCDDGCYDDEEGGEWFDVSCFYAGIGVGFTIGFCGVCGIFLINTSWRNAYFRFMHSLRDWLSIMIIIVEVAALRRN